MIDAFENTGFDPSACSGRVETDPARCGDVRLLVGITRRAADALAEVYRRHAGQVSGLALRLCGAGRAEDVVQEVFLDLWPSPERFADDQGSLRTVLLMQTYSRVARLRSDGARPGREGSDEIWRLVCLLPDEQRDAIVLASLQGHTYRDVARLLGEPEGTVKSRIRSGLTRLSLQLSRE